MNGIKGDKGDPGPLGPQGPIGPAGPPGRDGEKVPFKSIWVTMWVELGLIFHKIRPVGIQNTPIHVTESCVHEQDLCEPISVLRFWADEVRLQSLLLNNNG